MGYKNKCWYKGCQASSQGFHCSRFRFPVNDSDRCLEWLLRSGNSEELLKLPASTLRNRHICALHFPLDAFQNSTRKKLNHNALPWMVDSEIENKSDGPDISTDLPTDLPTDLAKDSAIENKSDEPDISTDLSTDLPTDSFKKRPVTISETYSISLPSNESGKIYIPNSWEETNKHHKCWYKGCHTSERNSEHGPVSFFRFPTKDYDRCLEWMLRSGSSEKLVQFTTTQLRGKYICGRHFPLKAFQNSLKKRLNHNALPLMADSEINNTSDKTDSSHKPLIRIPVTLPAPNIITDNCKRQRIS